MLETVGQVSNIKDLSLEVPQISSKIDPERKFNLLKRNYFDHENKLWSSLKPGSVDPGDGIYSRTQLVGAIVENLFDITSASDFYQRLLKSDMHDSDSGLWVMEIVHSKPDPEQAKKEFRIATDQMFGIYANSVTTGISPEDSINNLKGTAFADNPPFWNYGIRNLTGTVGILRDIYATTNLAEVLVTDLYDPKAAKQKFDDLKNTQLYDEQTGQWNGNLMWNGRIKDSARFSDAQLLGVLAEARFDKAYARARLSSLKQSPLYDPHKQIWAVGMSDNGSSATFSGDNIMNRLLEIWVEHSLQDQALELGKTPNMPEGRKF